MKNFTLAVEKIQQDMPSIISFAIITFFMELLSLGLLSFSVLREWKNSLIDGRDPDVARIIQKEVIIEDIKPWLYRSLMIWSIRFLMVILLLPMYMVSHYLMVKIPLLGVFAWLSLILLGGGF